MSLESAVTAADTESRLSWERELLGMYLSDHPLRGVADKLQQATDTTIAELGTHLDGLYVQIGGTLRDVRSFVPRRSTNGQQMAFLQIEDFTGHCEVVVFARIFEECASVLKPDSVVVVRGKVEMVQQPATVGAAQDTEVEFEPAAKIIADSIYALSDPRLLAWKQNAVVHLTVGEPQVTMLPALKGVMERHPGKVAVSIHVEGEGAFEEITLGPEYGVSPGVGLEREVESLLGASSYRLEVKRDRAPERDQKFRRKS